ncbi:MAG TPA: hypothetical protein VFP72_05700 [Kineosporiaceae bacterium]|nr:hypothetical protein [Kineosporiaceae bacterium]
METLSAQRAVLAVLLVPASVSVPVQVVHVPDSAAAIAAAIGADLLADEPITCPLPDSSGEQAGIYLAADAPLRPDNPRAAVLAARLGLDTDRTVMARLRGDILITGLNADSCADHDVPATVTDLAARHLRP